MAHLVNKLRFEVNCPNEDQAFGMRHNFAQTLQLQITSAIDKVCSQYVPGDEWIQIDTVEIDMGDLNQDGYDTVFEKKFLDRFEKELTAKLADIPAAERKNSIQQSMFDLLKHFLKTGTLQWWADESEINLEEISKNVFTNSEKLMEQFFLQQVNNVTVWQRVAFQLGDDAKKHVVKMLKPLETAKEIIDEMLTRLLGVISAVPGDQKITILKKLQWQAVKMDDLIIANAPAIFAAEDKQLQIKAAGAAVLLQLFASAPADCELVKTALNKILERTNALQMVQNKKEDNSEETLSLVSGNEIEDQNTYLNVATELTKHITEITNNEEDNEPQPEKLMVKSAGIILLAPFLKPFFTRLQLIKDNDWVSREAQVKAVYMLKYLGNGVQLCPEYQLVLEKLLCGIPINQPLETAPEFTQAETDEAEDLLHSVLEHWQRLKNTSVNGLRESFFKRDGILTAKENNWQLQIERKTMDVLLDSVPWGFSTVSLPWNEYIIFTEW